MSEEGVDETEALDDILPAEEPSHAPEEPALEVFKPWHLPRKHHLRKRQWADSLRHLLNDIPDRRLIKYLCLPGEDMLDVQVLADVCRENNRRLRYLGFDQSIGDGARSTQRLAAEQIVRQTDAIEDSSQVLPDDFTSIARPESIGNRRLRDGGSYDAVNLDMCDAFTTHAWAPTHAAILELLTHQCNRRGEPWLLFITSRSEVCRLQQPEVESYARAIRNNAGRSAGFRQSLANVGGLHVDANVATVLDSIAQQLDGDTYLAGRWLTIGIGKWLLGILGKNDPWRVDLLSAYAYRTGLLSGDGTVYAGEPPNLFSLVFRFEKIRQTRTDPAGLAPVPNREFAGFDEVKLAEKLAKRVEEHTTDLDRQMQDDPATHAALSDECEALLAVRYYSRTAYRAWIAGLPQISGGRGMSQ
jgi:hypothetical protein